jgi:hypothetical protein
MMVPSLLPLMMPMVFFVLTDAPFLPLNEAPLAVDIH